jgi:hypothetical protein
MVATTAHKAITAGSLSGATLRAGDLVARWGRIVQAWMGARSHVLEHMAAPDGGAPLLRLWFPGGTRRALLVAGMHGNEPAGARALLRFFQQGLAAHSGWSFDVLPLVNPLGFGRTRGHPACPDLNRSFGDPPECPETAAILRYLTAFPGGEGTPRWDLALSLHEDPERECLYLYDTGYRERHRFVAALAESNRFLDRVAARGVSVCDDFLVDGTPNHGGLVVGAQEEFPGLEPVLYRRGLAARVIVVETPGLQELPRREFLHVAALRHYLGSERHSPTHWRQR